MNDEKIIVNKVCETLIRASSTFPPTSMPCMKELIAEEKNLQAKWVMETILKNAQIAEKKFQSALR